MADLSEYFNKLIAELLSIQSTGLTPAGVQIVFSLILTILTSQFVGDPKVSYKNNPEILTRTKMEFDFIVVGSGSGGSVIGARLSEASSLTTLMLEAGCSDPMPASEVPSFFPTLMRSEQDWQYISKDNDTCTAMVGGCWAPRGKMFCGTPGMNLMFHVRGSYDLYDRWEKECGCNGWGSRDVIKYFLKSEGNTDHSLNRQYHCTKGPLKVSYYNYDNYTDFIMKGINEAGFPTVKDINVPHSPCVCRTQGTLYNGRRYAVCKAFVNPIQCRPNLKILKCAVVTRVLFDGNRATGVEFYYNGTRYRAYARKRVVLCAGSIGTPVILQLSGIGLQEDLDHNRIKSWLSLPVGRHLQDHFAVWLWFSFCGTTSPIGQLFSSITNYFSCPKTGDFAGIGTLAVVAFFNIKPYTHPTIECYFFLFTVQSLNLPVILKVLQYKPPIASKILELNKKSMILMVMPSLLDPKSEGKVRVDGISGPAAFDNPYIFFNYLNDREHYDRKSLIKAMQLALKLANSPTWKAACAQFIRLPGCEQYSNINSDEYCNCYLGPYGASIYHPVGTCKMGPKTSESVVNPECEVHGTEHLSVADASIMPIITTGNTNLPTVMIGEKCADYIKKQHGISVQSPRCERYKGDCACKIGRGRKSCCSCWSPHCAHSPSSSTSSSSSFSSTSKSSSSKSNHHSKSSC